MDIQSVLTELQSRFGDKFDVNKVSSLLGGLDLKNFSIDDIIEKVKSAGLIGDLDGDGVQESLIDELKGKASQMFGNIFK